MHQVRASGFWFWGKLAWRCGLKQAIKAASEQLHAAETEDERAEAQARLDELERQEADAKRNGGRWLH